MKPDRETLRHLYEDEKLSWQEVANRFGLGLQATSRLAIQYQIPTRSRSEQRKLVWADRKIPRDTAEICRLYLDDRRTIKSIADQMKISFATVRTDLLDAGIKLRSPSNGVANRGGRPPDRDTLRWLVGVEKMTTNSIGDFYGIKGSSVLYWLRKYKIKPLTRSQGVSVSRGGNALPDPDKETLSRLYDSGFCLEEIAEQSRCSRGVIVRAMKKYGLPIKPDGFDGGRRYLCADGHLVRSTYERQVDDWLSSEGVFHIYEPKLPKAPRFRSDFLANGWYIEVWGMSKSNKAYQSRRRRKEAIYCKLGLSLIGLEYWDFYEGRKAWQRKLSQCLCRRDSQMMLPLC